MGTGVMGMAWRQDRGYGGGVVIGMVSTGMVEDEVQFLFPCRPYTEAKDVTITIRAVLLELLGQNWSYETGTR